MRRILFALALLGAAPLISAQTAEPATRIEKTLQLRQGATRVEARLGGETYIDYRLSARAGQTLSAHLSARNASTYFNVLPPGSEQALFVGSTAGDRFRGRLQQDGVYTLRVYLMRAAARRRESTRFVLDVSLADPLNAPRPQASAPARPGAAGDPDNFDRSLSLQGVSFRVTTSGAGPERSLRIAPQGLALDNSPIIRKITGRVSQVELEDINADGSPELYIHVESIEAGVPRTSLIAYSANRRKSLSEIYLPPLESNAEDARGYAGRDHFMLAERNLLRIFPIFKDGQPTGRSRQIEYRLVAGEAGWLLKRVRASKF